MGDGVYGERVRRSAAQYRSAGVSAAAVLCDDHPRDRVAFTIVEADLTSVDLTYGSLSERSTAFAGGLSRLGIGPGDRVATLMGKSADYVVALLGIWRLGAVHVPLFTAFASAAIGTRLRQSVPKAVICDADQRSKLAPSDDIPADWPWVVIVAAMTGDIVSSDDIPYAAVIDALAPVIEPARLGGDAPLVELYTSGTTGSPKGVVVPTWALAAIRTYMEFGLDVAADDVYWCGADPGWAYGLYYAILGPLVLGVRSILVHANHSADLTWRVLVDFGVTNFAAAPTVYRSMRTTQAPVGLVIRHASSAGEPLTPEVNEWAANTLGVSVHDQYGQTEQGMVINNHQWPGLARPLKAGSMGQPMPGFCVVILDQDRDVVADCGVIGRVAIELSQSPLLWFGGYRNQLDAATKFTADGRFYLTGDLGSIDDDGYIFFSARDDDVILMAGYRIGPFEVESALGSHPEVAESAVVGAPDPIRGEIAVAYVVLREPDHASAELALELQEHVKQRYAAHAYPRVVHFTNRLPRTPSGKVQRFLLREQIRGASRR